MTDILKVYTEKIARERAEWIDYIILLAVPKWKRNLILKTKSKLVKKLLNVNIEIEYMTLIADFGTEIIIIKLNNKVIAKRKFKSMNDIVKANSVAN